MFRQRSLTALTAALILLALPVLAAEKKTTAGAKPNNIRLATGQTLASLVAAAGGELVFTPLPPCRVIDTREPGAGGRIMPSETRNYILRGPSTNYSSQGGNAAGCGIPDLTGSPLQENTAKAVALNIIAVGPLGAGHMNAWPANQATPVASVINYSNLPGLNIANGIILPICDEVSATPCATGDISVRAEVAGAFLVADVTGYFHAPAADNDVTSVTAGTGLTGGGVGGDVTVSLDTAFQLPQSCTDGQVAKWDTTGSAWECADDDDTGDITGVAAGTGLAGGGTSGDVAVSVAPSYQLPQTCADGEVAKWNATSSLWECVAVGGVGFTKADIYENVDAEQIAASSTLTNTVACNDANDIAIEGTCRPVPPGDQEVVIASEQALNWSSTTDAAEFRCVFKNQGASQHNTQTRILCITVP